MGGSGRGDSDRPELEDWKRAGERARHASPEVCSTTIAMNPDIGGRDVKEAQTEQEKTWILTGSDEHEERDLIKRGNRQPEVEFD
ncbi:hypothetical protein NDU88_002687 [Pleurodeles waltl]|uniref:Uncharacterized protein n=1 Tax=Pleurodeles waltl TaxID=8319 RepID=A0AAV7T3Z6_PLEWA|nr:hypothetical protein NDU88_002687 [Pleurodeles waltl]